MLVISEQNEGVYTRAKEAFCVNTDNQLAKAIGLGRSSIHSSRQRGTIPYGSMVEAILESNEFISLDWVFGNINSDTEQE